MASDIDHATGAIVEGAHRHASQRRPPLLRRIRFQLGGALLAGLVPPLPLVWPVEALRAGTPPILALHSASAAIPAIIVGYFLIRRFSPFSGSNAIGNVIPCMFAAFTGVLLLLAYLRVDYSLAYVASAGIMSSIWLILAYVLRNRYVQPTLALIPAGQRPSAEILRRVRWVHYNSPDADLSTVDAVVADLRAELTPTFERAITAAVLAGIPVYDVRQITEMLTGRVEVGILSENDFGAALPARVFHPVKRVFDVMLALAVLPVFVPAIAITGLLIRLESPGPAFFMQSRMGLRGMPFRIYKLRSMRTDTTGTSRAFTEENDPRITRIGRFIRKYRIDELPQVFNILKGEMSWIGPRPEALVLAEWYAREVPFYMFRHAVRPGITGWAQVCQGNVAEVDAAAVKLQYDFYYAKNFSAALDLLIVFKTIRIILTGFGSR